MTMARRKPDARTEMVDLQLEVQALLAERKDTGGYVGWMSRVLFRAHLQNRDDLVVEIIRRLDRLAERMIQQSGDTGSGLAA